MTTLKWVEQNYDYQEIVEAGPNTEIREDSVDVDGFENLQEVLDHFNVTPKEIKIEYGIWDAPSTFVTRRKHELDELERFKKGRAILRDREQERIKKEKQDEKDRK